MRAIELVGVDGSTWDLCSAPVMAGTSPAVWGTAPAAVSVQERFAAPGATVVNARHTSRDLVIPLDVKTTPAASIEQTLADLARAVDPVLGDVTVRVTRPDGSQRSIAARYLSGLELVSLPTVYANRARAALSLRAHWPYWASVETDTVTIEPPDSQWSTSLGTDYDDDIPYAESIPYQGTSNATGDAVLMNIDNPGDVDAWPVFEIVGPATRISAINNTTGRDWVVSSGLAIGETLTVHTRPGEVSVRVNGVGALARLDDGAELWPLIRGPQEIVLEQAGRDVGNGSAFRMWWTPEYLSP